MHCELVVPGLLAAPSSARLPGVELLMARGRCSRGSSESLEAWLQDAFDVAEEPLAAGALTFLGAGGEPAGERWSRADPVHLRLLRDRMVLVPPHALRVTPDEARTLAAALNAHFGERLPLEVADAERWVASVAPELEVGEQSPLTLAGRDVAAALAAAAGSAAHRLLNEAQMVLHEHPVNEAREARGEPAINSIWLWGAGRLPQNSTAPWQSVSAADPLVLGFARAAGIRQRALPASAAAWLDRAPEDGRHLIVLDALRAPLALGEAADYEQSVAALERDWFAPLLGALREGRIGMVTIHVPDAAQCVAYETIRTDLRRFWRRPRALEHYA
jgi:hypothetical protein